MDTHRLEIRVATTEEEHAAVACLQQHTREAGGRVTDEQRFSVLAVCEGAVVGGLIGKVFWNWLYADLIWVEKAFRRRGIGKDVMQAAEQKARALGLSGSYRA